MQGKPKPCLVCNEAREDLQRLRQLQPLLFPQIVCFSASLPAYYKTSQCNSNRSQHSPYVHLDSMNRRKGNRQENNYVMENYTTMKITNKFFVKPSCNLSTLEIFRFQKRRKISRIGG